MPFSNSLDFLQPKVCMLHISKYFRNMQECPGRPRGVINKELTLKPRAKDYYNSRARLSARVCVYVWVFAFMLEGGLVCVFVRVEGADC